MDRRGRETQLMEVFGGGNTRLVGNPDSQRRMKPGRETRPWQQGKLTGHTSATRV